MSGLELWLPDDSALATSAVFPAQAAGTTSAAQQFKLWFDKGGGGGSIDDVYYQVEVEYPPSSGTWVSSGVPALDRKEFVARVSGADKTGDPAMEDQNDNFTAIGSGSVLEFSPISGNCARYFDLEWHPTGNPGARVESIHARLVPVFADVSILMQQVLPHLPCGILTGLGNPLTTGFVDVPLLTESGAPDDYVHVARTWWMWGGVSRRRVAEPYHLDQNDGSAVALGVGKEYTALFSRGSGTGALTVSKSPQAGAGLSVVPALPTGERAVAKVVVIYQAGGTSIIHNADITVLARGDRGRITASGGLNLSVNPFRAWLAGAYARTNARTTIALPDNATRFVWLDVTGSWVLTAAEAPPTAGAELWYEATTLSGSVTVLVDRRRFVDDGPAEVLRFEGDEAVSAGGWKVFRERRCIDRMALVARKAAVGASGATTFDVLRSAGDPDSGTSIFSDTANRPALAAGDRIALDAHPDVTELDAGDALSLSCADVTTGGTARAADFDLEIVTGRIN